MSTVVVKLFAAQGTGISYFPCHWVVPVDFPPMTLNLENSLIENSLTGDMHRLSSQYSVLIQSIPSILKCLHVEKET